MADKTVFDRIKKLSERQGITIVDVEAKLGFSKNYLYKWKKSVPSSDKLAKVADFFGVSTDYLLGREKQKSKTADLADNDVIFTYQGKPLSDEDKELIKRLMNGKN